MKDDIQLIVELIVEIIKLLLWYTILSIINLNSDLAPALINIFTISYFFCSSAIINAVFNFLFDALILINNCPVFGCFILINLLKNIVDTNSNISSILVLNKDGII